MIYVQYAFMSLVSLPLTLLAFIIAPILPFFASKDGWLPKWLFWFQTPDNSLDGDSGWKNEHWQFRYKLPNALGTYVGRVGWLWRNPAYAFGCRYIDGNSEVQYSGDPTIKDNDGAKEGSLLVKVAGLFQYVYVKQIGSTGKCLYINFGWNVRALIEPSNKRKEYQATFVCSPRISGFRP